MRVVEIPTAPRRGVRAIRLTPSSVHTINCSRKIGSCGRACRVRVLEIPLLHHADPAWRMHARCRAGRRVRARRRRPRRGDPSDAAGPHGRDLSRLLPHPPGLSPASRIRFRSSRRAGRPSTKSIRTESREGAGVSIARGRRTSSTATKPACAKAVAHEWQRDVNELHALLLPATDIEMRALTDRREA